MIATRRATIWLQKALSLTRSLHQCECNSVYGPSECCVPKAGASFRSVRVCDICSVQRASRVHLRQDLVAQRTGRACAVCGKHKYVCSESNGTTVDGAHAREQRRTDFSSEPSSRLGASTNERASELASGRSQMAGDSLTHFGDCGASSARAAAVSDQVRARANVRPRAHCDARSCDRRTHRRSLQVLYEIELARTGAPSRALGPVLAQTDHKQTKSSH